MNKVKCANGHFFDADRFNGCCPICRSTAAGQVEDKKSRTPVQSIRKSRLDNMDKTELLVEEQKVVSESVVGKSSGIKWRLGTKKPEEVSQVREKSEPVQNQAVEEKDPPVVRSMQPSGDRNDVSDVSEQPAKEISGGSSLTQAVAATGHGAFSALPKTTAYYELEAETEPPTGWLVCTKGAHRGEAFACKSGRNRIGRNPSCNISLMNDTSITREPHAMIIYDPKDRKFYLQNGTGDGLVYRNGSLLFSHEELKAYDKVQMGTAEFVFVPLCGEQFTWDDYIG